MIPFGLYMQWKVFWGIKESCNKEQRTSTSHNEGNWNASGTT